MTLDIATMQRMDAPLVMLGFEMSGNIEACERYEKVRP